MASSATYANLSPVLATLFQDAVEEQLNRAAVLVHVLPKKLSFSRDINIPIRATDSQVASTAIYLAPGADVTQFNSDGKLNAHGEHATISEAFSVDNFALNAAAATGNPLALADVLREEFVTATMRLCSNLNKQCYIGLGTVVSSAQTVQGLTVLGTDGYYGSDKGWLSVTNTALFGQSQVATPAWKSNVLGNSGVVRDISFNLMEAAERVVYERSGESVQAWMCDGNQWSKLASLFTATTTQFRSAQSAGDMTYDMGANRLAYRGIPIIKDKDCPAGVLLGLTPQHISLQQMPFAAKDVTAANHGYMDLMSGQESQFGGGSVPLTVHVRELPAAGDYVKFQLVAYPQLAVKRPGAQVLITDLRTSYVGL